MVGYNALGLGGSCNCLLIFPATPGGERKALALQILRTASGDGLETAVIGPGAVVLAVDAGAPVVSYPWLSPHGSSGQKAIRKFNIGEDRKKKQAGSDGDEEKAGGGASEPSPGGRFPRFPLAEVGRRRPFFRRHVVVLLCG